jgi:hypothetical protein
VLGAKNLTIRQVQQMSVQRMLYIIGTNELQYLFVGGLTTSTDVVLAHYTGFAGGLHTLHTYLYIHTYIHTCYIHVVYITYTI